MILALDTNIIIRYLRNESNVRLRVHEAVMSGGNLIIPQMVDYEIKRGFRVYSAPNKEAAYRVFTGTDACCCDIVEMDTRSWERAEHVYADLYRKGLTIGEIDILIAAFCLERGCILVTNNTKHFECIDGLQIADWVNE